MKHKKRRDGKHGKRGTAPVSAPVWRVDAAGRVYWQSGPLTVRHTDAEGNVTIRHGVIGRYYSGEVRTAPEEEEATDASA